MCAKNLLSAKHYESCRHQKRSLSPSSRVEIKPGYPALAYRQLCQNVAFSLFFYNRNVFMEILNKSNTCRDVQYGVTRVM